MPIVQGLSPPGIRPDAPVHRRRNPTRCRPASQVWTASPQQVRATRHRPTPTPIPDPGSGSVPFVQDAPGPGLSTISEAIADIAAGKMVILVDDEDRENEGDLVHRRRANARAEAINFMAKCTGGA